MLHYYLQMAFRNLRNKAGFYAINIAGLALGLAACLMITHYVRFHNSFDQHHPDSERIYRISYSRWAEDGSNKVVFASATPVIGKALMEYIPEIEIQGQAYRMEGIFSHEDRFFEETRVFMAETNLLNLLGINITEGLNENTLDEPTSAVISRSAAQKYFGDECPLGKTLYHNHTALYEVVGIFEDMPANTHFKADMFMSMERWKQQNPNLFQNAIATSGFYNYIKLAAAAEPSLVEEKMDEYVNETYNEVLSAWQTRMGFTLQPIEDIHLHSHLMHELEQNGNAASVKYLSIVAWFILVIAWVNFFNLSTIAAIRKLREISIRKVNGASHGQLLTQLLTESALINLMAIAVALLLFEVVSPLFFSFADLPTNTPIWHQPWVYILVVVALIIGTLSAGIYAVAGIPTSHVLDLLKGINIGLKGKASTRKMLVTLQFTIAIGLIAATLAIIGQYKLISQKPLGFSLENKLVVHSPLLNDSLALVRFNTMKNELEKVPQFEGATYSSVIPGKPNMYNRDGIYLHGAEPTTGKNYRITEVDPDFLGVYAIDLLAGEDFSGHTQSDWLRVLLNQRASEWAGFESPEEAIGRQMVIENAVYTITGVVGDFHQLSPKEAIEPQIFRMPRRHKGYLTINYGNTPAEVAVENARMIYTKHFTRHPFEYFFLDDYYNHQNLGEKRFGVVFLLFSGLVILVTILGLIGLSAYTAEQRRKEIGIRKILGASPIRIFNLMFRDYLVLWALGALFALPAAYYLIDKWLASFAIRIEPGYGFFLLPLAGVLLVALTTVFLQSMKVLRMNPAQSIQSN